MAKKRPKIKLNQIIIDEFSRLGGLNEQEITILRDRMLGVTRLQMCHKYNMSTSTIDRKIIDLAERYDAVQPFSDKLPKRPEYSPTEEYLDSH